MGTYLAFRFQGDDGMSIQEICANSTWVGGNCNGDYILIPIYLFLCVLITFLIGLIISMGEL